MKLSEAIRVLNRFYIFNGDIDFKVVNTIDDFIYNPKFETFQDKNDGPITAIVATPYGEVNNGNDV